MTLLYPHDTFSQHGSCDCYSGFRFKAKGLSGSRMPVSNRAAVADACGKNHASSDGIHGSCCGCKEKELVGRGSIHRPSPSRPHPQPCYQPAPPPAMCFQTGLGLQHQHIQTSTGLVFSQMKTTSKEQMKIQVFIKTSINISASQMKTTSEQHPNNKSTCSGKNIWILDGLQLTSKPRQPPGLRPGQFSNSLAQRHGSEKF